jgi:phospholipid-binding lipoprotein MlaA
MALALTTASPPSPEPASPAPPPAAAPAHAEGTPGDPFEHLNRKFFNLNERVDRTLIGPTARGYKHTLPTLLQNMLHNLVTNFSEPVVMINDALQLRPKRTLSTAFRFAVNTTAGLGGLFDAAKMAKVEHHDNDFGITLGRWGAPPGPFLYLPLLGPTTVRDTLGKAVDGFVIDPLNWCCYRRVTVRPHPPKQPYLHHYNEIHRRNEIRLAEGILSGIDQRARVDEDLDAVMSTATDPYATLRSLYLQNRAAEVDQARWHHTEVPEFETPADGSGSAAATGTTETSPAAPANDVVDQMDAEDRARSAAPTTPAAPGPTPTPAPAPAAPPVNPGLDHN